MGVKFTDLQRAFLLHQEEYENAALRALRSGWYIMGSELESFEKQFATYLGVRHCIGVGCGQDALIIAVRALDIGPGDEVIVAGNTFIATVLGITENGAEPVFVDCNEFFQIDETLIESAITNRTKAILVTNLYGQPCNLRSVREICNKHGLAMLEDCAQSHGAHYDGELSGTYGDISCFSFYPTKPLGAFGDAGACVTNNSELADRITMLRNYGSKQKYVNEKLGINSRLDEIQAAMLKVGLEHIEESTKGRIIVAERYLAGINNAQIELPKIREKAEHVWHIFPVLCNRRDDLHDYLLDCGISTQIHYPIPPHKAQCYADRGYGSVSLPVTERFAETELSLPVYTGMPDEDVQYVIECVNRFR